MERRQRQLKAPIDMIVLSLLVVLMLVLNIRAVINGSADNSPDDRELPYLVDNGLSGSDSEILNELIKATSELSYFVTMIGDSDSVSSLTDAARENYRYIEQAGEYLSAALSMCEDSRFTEVREAVDEAAAYLPVLPEQGAELSVDGFLGGLRDAVTAIGYAQIKLFHLKLDSV